MSRGAIFLLLTVLWVAFVVAFLASSPPRAAGTSRTIASWMPERYGARYLALPEGAGVRVRICGKAACIVLVSNDAGPSRAMQRAGRGVDLAVLVWERVTGYPRSRGLAWVTVERLGGTR